MGVFKFSHFLPNAWGHGGNKRTAQINEILTNAGIAFSDSDFSKVTPNTNRLLLYLKGLAYRSAFSNNIKGTYAMGRYLKNFEHFAQTAKPDIFILEATNDYNLYIAEVMSKRGIPVIGLPHNLEALVSGNVSVVSKQTSPQWLREEIKQLSYCDHIFAISREEAWLLSNFGLSASYLPYYPPTVVREFLIDIRRHREAKTNEPTAKKNILLLGTFYNKPTFDGYTELIKHIDNYRDIIINVAGYGSDMLAKNLGGDNVHIWGDVDNQTLSGLLIRCDYAVISQPPSSGALTRIPEFLIAGIPVLANTHAARSYFDYEGLTVYKAYDDLPALIEDQTAGIPPMLTNPAEEQHFVNFIKSILKKA